LSLAANRTRCLTLTCVMVLRARYTHNFSRVIVRQWLQIGSYCCHEYHVVGDFMVARKFTVFLEPAEEGGFIVKCGELPVATQGETREEALKNIKETIEGYLEVKAKLLGSKIKGEKAEVIVEARALGVKF